MARAEGVFQSSSPISRPDGVSQAMSARCPSPARSPRKYRRRRNTGCSRRSAASARVKSSSPAAFSAMPQSTQESSLSWQ